MSNDLLATAKRLHSLTNQLVNALCARPSDPFGPVRARQAWLYLRQALISAGNNLPAHPHPLANWIRELGKVAKQFDELLNTRRMDEVLRGCPTDTDPRKPSALQWSNLEDDFCRLIGEGERLLKENTPKPVDPFAFVDPPPTSTSTPPTGTQQGEGGKPKPAAKPDGPFDADGFRFAGVEVKFGKAGKQYRLVMALWDATKNAPAAPRPVEEVIAEVWGDDNETEDAAFRQLCADTRARFQRANCPLNIQQTNGYVQLSPL